MKKIRSIALMMAMLMTLAVFSGCGKDSEKENEDVKETTSETTAETPIIPSEGFTAEKIGSIKEDNVNLGKSALYYQSEDGKYGIMSFDGKNDTGAKYSVCEPQGNWFMVATKGDPSLSDISTLNVCGVVDSNGKEIIPMQYASIKNINERYIEVCEVTEQTDNKEDALVYFTDDMFSISASDDDIFFKGKWYVYDATTGKILDGVTGTKSGDIYSNGDFIKYTSDSGEEITVNHKGERLPDDADLFDNGYYALEEEGKGAVYDSENNKIFTYDIDGFVPTDSIGEYILAANYDVVKYVLMDYTGKTVSAELDSYPNIYGNLLLVDDKLCTFDGKAVVDNVVKNVYFEEQYKNAWIFEDDSDEYYLYKDGKIVFHGNEDEGCDFDYYDSFVISKEIDDKNYCYSLKKNDFVIEGDTLAPWLVSVEKSDGTCDVVDVTTDKTIIEGYSNYFANYIEGNNKKYIYAKKSDGGIDVFEIK